MATAPLSAALPAFVGKRPGARHPAFGTQVPASERARHHQALVLDVLAQARGRSLNALEINQVLVGRSQALKPYALYRALRQLSDDGRLQHEWSERNGRAAAAYRPSSAPAAETGRIACRGCGRQLDLPADGLLSRLIAESCGARGMTLGTGALDIGVLCRACDAGGRAG